MHNARHAHPGAGKGKRGQNIKRKEEKRKKLGWGVRCGVLSKRRKKEGDKKKLHGNFSFFSQKKKNEKKNEKIGPRPPHRRPHRLQPQPRHLARVLRQSLDDARLPGQARHARRRPRRRGVGVRGRDHRPRGGRQGPRGFAPDARDAAGAPRVRADQRIGGRGGDAAGRVRGGAGAQGDGFGQVRRDEKRFFLSFSFFFVFSFFFFRKREKKLTFFFQTPLFFKI